MALINLAFAKTMTGITDDTTCQFYIDATIKKIEKIIGYPLASTKRVDYIDGVNTENIWLYRKPVTAVSLVKIGDDTLTVTTDYTTRDLTSNNPYIKLVDRILCKYEEAEIETTAGFADGLVDQDIQMLIFNTIKAYESSLNENGLKSYRIDKISYDFFSYLERNQSFNNSVSEIFGLN
jgi:hypothetical protein